MTSKERLLACLRGQLPDRVPISTYELNGWNADSFENKDASYARLMEFIRQNTDCIYMTWEGGAGNARGSQWSWSHEKWDEGDQHVTRSTLHTPQRKLSTLTSRSDNVMTTWTREHLCKDLDDLWAYLDMPWEPGEPDFAPLKKALADLGGERGIPMLDMSDPLCDVAALFDMETFVVLAMTEPEAMTRAMDRFHERHVESVRRILAGPVKDCLWRICGPEYATPPFLPPELFARYVTTYDRVYCRMMREAGVFPRIHSHGKIARVLEELLKIDPAAIDPVEPPPDGDITLEELKRRAPGLVMMGGIELKHLEARDEGYVDQLVRDLMAQGKPLGRYVILPTAAPINLPLAAQTERNYMRWIQTAVECGAY